MVEKIVNDDYKNEHIEDSEQGIVLSRLNV